jgi:aminoglycoside 3-N-acetyltransferase
MDNSTTLGFRDIVLLLREAGEQPDSRILVLGPGAVPDGLRGGLSTLFAALRSNCRTLLAPAFTYQTMVYPPEGPPDNGVDYTDITAISTEAEFYRRNLPVSPAVGPLADFIRRSDGAVRSAHPILSFSGLNAEDLLETQTIEDPFAPVDALSRAGGDALLIGVDHTANIALHLAAQRAGRKQFVRWALTPEGVVECPGFPGCPNGFGAIESKLYGISQIATAGGLRLERIPLRDLIHAASGWIRGDPNALLCDDAECLLCGAVRKSRKPSAK